MRPGRLQLEAVGWDGPAPACGDVIDVRCVVVRAVRGQGVGHWSLEVQAVDAAHDTTDRCVFRWRT